MMYFKLIFGPTHIIVLVISFLLMIADWAFPKVQQDNPTPELINKFGLRVFGQLSLSQKDVIFSPPSLYGGLSMFAIPSMGNTRDQLVSAMGLTDSQQLDSNLTKYFSALQDPIFPIIGHSSLAINDREVHPSYVKFIKKVYNADVIGTSYDSIYGWEKEVASQHSLSNLPPSVNIVPPGTISKFLQFSYAKLSLRGPVVSLAPSDLNQTNSTSFISNATYYRQGDLQALQVPLSSGGLFLVLVQCSPLGNDLQKKDSPFRSLQALEALNEVLTLGNPQKVELSLPSYNLVSSFDLSSLLGAIGMSNLFSSVSDDFTPLQPPNLSLASFNSLTVVCFAPSVEEDTSKGLEGGVFQPLKFDLSKGFSFYVYDMKSRLLFLLGNVSPK